MGANSSKLDDALSYGTLGNLYPVETCNSIIIARLDRDEGCIINGVLDTAKTREQCVIDETSADQTAVYCDDCGSAEGCNLVHYLETKEDTENGLTKIDVMRVAKSCDDVPGLNGNTDPFCFTKFGPLVNAYSLPPGYGMVMTVPGDDSVLNGLCMFFMKESFLCDGKEQSNLASLQNEKEMSTSELLVALSAKQGSQCATGVEHGE